MPPGLPLRGGAPELGPRATGHWLTAAVVSWLWGGVGWRLMRLVWGGWGENWKLELVTTVRVKSILEQGWQESYEQEEAGFLSLGPGSLPLAPAVGGSLVQGTHWPNRTLDLESQRVGSKLRSNSLRRHRIVHCNGGK